MKPRLRFYYNKFEDYDKCIKKQEIDNIHRKYGFLERINTYEQLQNVLPKLQKSPNKYSYYLITEFQMSNMVDVETSKKIIELCKKINMFVYKYDKINNFTRNERKVTIFLYPQIMLDLYESGELNSLLETNDWGLLG